MLSLKIPFYAVSSLPTWSYAIVISTDFFFNHFTILLTTYYDILSCCFLILLVYLCHLSQSFISLVFFFFFWFMQKSSFQHFLEERSSGGACMHPQSLQSCPTLCDPKGYPMSLPGSSVHGILQTSVLEWVAITTSRLSSWLRNWTHVYCIAGKFFTHWTTWEAPSGDELPQFWLGKPLFCPHIWMVTLLYTLRWQFLSFNILSMSFQSLGL